jgi:L-lactate dehydrogenase (cytochrome)
VFDYIDGGAEDESTLRANCRAFEAVTLRPRCAVATPVCDLRTTVLGTSVSMPLILAPVGSCRLMFPRGEEKAARAAGEAGIICTLSTLSGCRLEDVAAASGGPIWYQLYLIGGRDCALAGIDRARKAGFSALVVTIDTPVAGLRERDLRNGAKELLSGKLGPMLPFVNQLLVRPRWLAAFLADGGLMKFENVVIPGKGPMLYADVTAALEQSVVTWDDINWIRQAWNGPIVIKGVHTAEDARRAVDMGAQGLVVSNHGGRQLAGVAPTLRVLPEVVAAVGDRIEVLLDGGIRRGSDIVKALCLGARAVMAGRAYAYGLGAAGGAGVARAIEILRADLVRTLKLLGCASIAELNGTYVDVPRDWLAK